VKFLLDENFPLPLYHRLQAIGHDVDHIIVLGLRGAPDQAIRQRLAAEDVVFLTQDTEFLDAPGKYRATIVVSRVQQSLPIAHRVDLWMRAIEEFVSARPAGDVFELLETGEIVPWQVIERS
jgi:hypothetical protein